jgi:hypothetical protein
MTEAARSRLAGRQSSAVVRLTKVFADRIRSGLLEDFVLFAALERRRRLEITID